jgi:glycerol uptake facilitator-like aquaporin
MFEFRILNSKETITAKSFLYTIRKHRMKILIAIKIAFILLLILGYAINPDRTWGPGVHEQPAASR